MEFRQIAINFLIVALCFFGIFSFGKGLVEENGHDSSLIDDGSIDFTELEETIEETNEDALKWDEIFRSDNPLLSFGALAFFSIWAIIKLVIVVVFDIFYIIFLGASNVFQLSPVVMGLLRSILILGLIAGGYSLAKTGR